MATWPERQRGDRPACWLDAGPIDYAAAGDGAPIFVPAHRYEKTLA